MSNLENTKSTQKVIFNEDLSRHIQGYGSELERIRTDVLAKLRSPELFKWQSGRPGTDNKTYYIQSYDIKKLIQTNKLDPNAKYDDGTSLVTQAIRNVFYAYDPTNKVPIMVVMNINQILDAIVSGGATLTPEDEADIAKIRAMGNNFKGNKPEWMGSNAEAMYTATDIITNKIPYGPNLEARTEKDLLEYMGTKGGRRKLNSRKLRSRKLKRSSVRNGRRLSGRNSRKLRSRNGRKLSRRLGRKLRGG